MDLTRQFEQEISSGIRKLLVYMLEQFSCGRMLQQIRERKTSDDDAEEPEIPCWIFDESEAVNTSSAKWSTTNELAFTHGTVVRRIYTLARILHDSLTKSGMRYWTSGGTTLGCVRHQGLIPWDDDLDLCIYEKDEGKINDCLRGTLTNNGCEIIEAPVFGYRVFHKFESHNLPGEHQNHRYPFCDIFVMKKMGETCSIASGCGRALWPEEYYYNDDIVNVEAKLFGDIYLNCPRDAKGYLCRTYGENWHSEGATHNYDHVHQQYVRSVRFKLDKEHYQPAQPFV